VPANWPIGKICREAAQIVSRAWTRTSSGASDAGAQARQLWGESDRVFNSNTGWAPKSRIRIMSGGRLLLKEAAGRDARLHDARYTAATVILVLDVRSAA
jgi:hypothetical protein